MEKYENSYKHKFKISAHYFPDLSIDSKLGFLSVVVVPSFYQFTKQFLGFCFCFSGKGFFNISLGRTSKFFSVH